jgi:hypothetical protein
MAVDVQEVKGFVANTKEFAVLVQNNCVAESLAQLNFHDSRCKVFGVSTGLVPWMQILTCHSMQ